LNSLSTLSLNTLVYPHKSSHRFPGHVSAHQRPEAEINDILFQSENSSLLSRAAWIKNYGIAVKTATIFPDNATKFPDLPTVQSLVTLFDDNSGAPQAIIEGNFLTKWKTAGDSVLGAKLLARKESQVLTILGAQVSED